MQNIFDEVKSLDQRCYERFLLSEDILMEHAAAGMADLIKERFLTCKSVFIACGGGNNGADGMALARLLHKDFDVKVQFFKTPISAMAKLQAQRLERLGVEVVSSPVPCDIIVDALFGTGLKREFDEASSRYIELLNRLEGVKIACDVPSGLHASGACEKESFVADITITMGALKSALFSDCAKDIVAEIQVLDLGVSRTIYETSSKMKFLEFTDMQLPRRKMQNSHKGSFGHLAVVSGEKLGASVLCALAALRFGTALVTLVSNEKLQIPTELMLSHQLPKNSSAMALGMGLGVELSQNELHAFLAHELPLLLDADIFYHPFILQLLERKKIVLTPHPKEFVQLLHVSGVAEVSVQTLQNNRFFYAKLFAKRYPDAVLVLKGANVLIAQDDMLFVNPHGTNLLAKGGSGDVLSGLIASLLAQGYDPLQAAITGSLAHTKLAQNYKGTNNFSLLPNDLIDEIRYL